ncbi:E3 ubiquitin-protein ligase goliath isoform X1 [Wyeomyia smithii]|uniref:E3 ubiquitin-protein ligase goliath isoform X1 n=1 Tax=Wyeomyia smithii TaxID=174621 RepID=UPI002467B3ED|nr:E3 ubiquitin-protein ligase goliath isoform X1 [Wyeomyia smithii]XP_055527409.1 E3 ubiquitin-protein ligase goliath isoform X1 [Wyeomyia smithii]
MSALSHQVNMNNFLSLLVGASLVAANSSPSHHDLTSFSQPTEFSNGVSSFALPAEDRMAFDSYTLAYLNYSYVDSNKIPNQEGDLIGKYGEGRILNRTGLLVHVTKSDNEDDHTGCTKDWNGTKGRPLPPLGVQWIALIKRGSCNFEEKVKHAYTHGAAGVIIYNDKDDPRLDKMKINDKERNITAVFTTKAKGHELIDILERLEYEVTMSILEGSHHYRSLANINSSLFWKLYRTSVLFVSISFIVLMIISLVWLVFYYVQRFRYLQTKDKQSRRLCNVAKRIIGKIPTKSIKSDDKEIDNDCCAICIEPYKVTDVIRVLPCKHEFHKICIDPWLLEHRTCPMCKMDILKHYGFVFTGSQESILQLDMDMEEGDLIDDHSSTDGGGYQRRHSVSPLPQIRASNEHQLSRSSSESDLDREHRRARGSNSLQQSHRQSLRTDSMEEVIVDGTSGCATVTDQPDKSDICVGCLAAALNKKQRNADGTYSKEDADSDSYGSEQHGSSSLPATLKKYKGNHSTGSCRGMNPPDHYHQYPPQQNPQSKLPFKFYKTDGGQARKIRTPLKNVITQSKSAPCDDGSLTDINLGTSEQAGPTEDPPAVTVAMQAKSARRCSLSRTSSSGSESRNFAHYQHQMQQPHSQHHHHQQSSVSEPEPDDDGSDETEPNSDIDLIAKSKDGNDAADGKKK